MTGHFGTIVATLIALGIRAHSLVMPDPISAVSLGMSIDAFAASHPDAKQYSIDRLGPKPLEPSKLKTGFVHIAENLSQGAPFTRASYGFQNGQLVTIEIQGHVPRGKEQKTRQEIIKKCIGIWGPQFQKLPLVDETSIYQRLAALVWIADAAEIVLTLPRNPTEKEFGTMTIVLSIRAPSIWKRSPKKGPPMEMAAKEALFKANDIP